MYITEKAQMIYIWDIKDSNIFKYIGKGQSPPLDQELMSQILIQSEKLFDILLNSVIEPPVL